MIINLPNEDTTKKWTLEDVAQYIDPRRVGYNLLHCKLVGVIIKQF